MIPQYLANFPDQSKSMIDSDGKATANWWLMFRAIWSRTGLGNGVPNQVANNLSATGTTQATGLVLNLDWNEVLTTAAGSGVTLLSVQPGQTQVVFNGGANGLNVYPPAGFQIDALGANAPYTLASGKTQMFGTYSNTQIRSVQLG